MFLKTEELIFQESVIVDEFIKENYTVVDNVGEFKVYTKEGALKQLELNAILGQPL